jgi:hypothetical protein
MERTPVRLGVITEVHIVPPGSPPGVWHNPFLFDQAEALFRDAVARCVKENVDAIALLGDLTHYADAGSFAVVRRVLETVELPVYVLPGNHDLERGPQPMGAFQRALDLPNVILPPVNMALTPGIDLALIGLEPGDGEQRYAAVHSRAVTGNDPALTVVLTHFPPFAMADMLAGAGLKHAGDLTNREPWLAALAGIPGPVLVVNGHLHVHATIEAGRVLQLSAAALIEPPHDVTILTLGIDENSHPWAGRRATGLFEVPGVSLPVLSAREECWRFDAGSWRQSSDARSSS